MWITWPSDRRRRNSEPSLLLEREYSNFKIVGDGEMLPEQAVMIM